MAKADRWGYDGRFLLDWQNRMLTDLKFPYGRDATAVERGFLVFNAWWWDYKPRPITLERYDSEGQWIWSAVISRPDSSNVDEACRMGSAAIWADKEHVMFYNRCGKKELRRAEQVATGKKYRIMVVDIKRSDLPSF